MGLIVDGNFPGSPKPLDLAGGGGGGYDDLMEARVAKLESEITAIKIDVAVIKANGATKSDVSEAKSTLLIAVAESKAQIIMWVVTAIILAQLLPGILKKFGI